MKLLILAAVLAYQEPPPFPDADPASAIAAARKRAAEENRTVIVLWGSNDSEKSIAAARILRTDKAVKKLLLYEYDLVYASEKTDAPRVSLPTEDGKPGDKVEAPADAKAWVELLEKH
jgi:hypothetical protein